MPAYKRTALGGAGAGRRFFAGGADNVVPANISDVPGLVASGWLPVGALPFALEEAAFRDVRTQYQTI